MPPRKKRPVVDGNVIDMARWQIRRNARAFMALPEAERRRQLQEMVGLTFRCGPEEKGPAQTGQKDAETLSDPDIDTGAPRSL